MNTKKLKKGKGCKNVATSGLLVHQGILGFPPPPKMQILRYEPGTEGS